MPPSRTYRRGVERTTVRHGGLVKSVGSERKHGYVTPADERPAVWGVDGLPGGSALLVVKRGPDAGARFWLDQHVTTVGRHPHSDIFLDDATTSRRHAEFRSNGGEFHLVDADSLHGTFVNGTPVDSAMLVPGDEIHIGKFCLVFLNQLPTG